MRPLELVVEGFRSFGARTVFDWRGRRLIGIVGPIGSGKSSILDAIAFALYGKTPVFERENKTLINQSLEQARVELAFAVDGQVWRAVRVIRRKGASQHALYRIDQGPDGELEPEGPPEHEREREVSAGIESLLGLDFPAFNRSVMLAQNRFARFLEASASERDRVLKGVFGFDRVDAMHAEARNRRERAEVRASGLRGRRETLEDDRARLAEARRALAATTARAEVLEQAAPAVRALLAAEQDAARDAAAARDRLAELDALTVRAPDRREIESRLAATAGAAEAHRRALETRDAARAARRRADRDHRATLEEVASSEVLERAERALEARRRARVQADRRRHELESLRAEVEDLERAERRAAHRAEAAAEAGVAAEREVVAAREARARARDTLAGVEREVGDRAAIARVEARLEELARARERAGGARRERRREAEALADVEAGHRQADDARRAARADEARAERALERRQAARRDAEAALEHARHSDRARALARTLEPGAPCPVCGREVTELPAGGEDGGDGSDPLAAAEEACRDAQDRERAAADALRAAAANAAAAAQAAAGSERSRDEARRRFEQAGARARAAEKACSELAATLTDQIGLGDPAERLAHASGLLERAAGDTAAADEDVRRARETAAERASAIRLAEERAAGAARARSEAVARVAAAEAELATLEGERSSAEGTLRALLGDGDPEVLLGAVKERLRAAERAREAAREAEQDAGRAVERAAADLEEAGQREQELSRRLANIAGSLGSEVPAGGEAELDTLQARVSDLLEVTQTSALTARAGAERRRSEAETERRRITAGLELEADEELEAVLAAARGARAGDRATVETLEARLARAAALDQELEAAEAELARYRLLSDDLTAPRFLRYLLDEERATLAELGSARFEMLTGGRYRFTADGSFAVIDLANAESVRKVETLSGGETFLASLALALALAEMVTGGGGRLDAFFLDEGFGSLDEEHLDLAMEGIERLVTDAGERLVTVVSHVAALRQRVDDLIVLDKDPLTGASIVVRGNR